MIFAPQSNQGLLFGIFVTGPLGMVVGAILGALYGLFQYRRQKRNSPSVIQG
jgi:F0F1-type ATP synthase assembly protein I